MEAIRVIALICSVVALCIAVTGLVLTLTRMKKLVEEREGLREKVRILGKREESLRRTFEEKAAKYTEIVVQGEHINHEDGWSVHELKRDIREKFIKMITEDIESYIDWGWSNSSADYMKCKPMLQGKISIKKKG